MPPDKSFVRAPRMAEVVADLLRERVLSGDLRGAKELPSQERLLTELAVPRQVLREALRTLELEGLLTVRRGNVGGATIHLPTARETAYGLGLVLQARGVTLRDAGAALAQLEPLCVRMAALRKDRKRNVIPRLQRVNEESAAALDDIPTFMATMSRFHREVVASCGNETLAVVAGAIEELWLAQVDEWSIEVAVLGQFPEPAYREAGIREHERLVELIRDGDLDGATDLAASHFNPKQFYSEPTLARRPIRAAGLRAKDASHRAKRGRPEGTNDVH